MNTAYVSHFMSAINFCVRIAPQVSFILPDENFCSNAQITFVVDAHIAIIAKISVTAPIVMPTRELLAGDTKDSFV